MRNGVILKKGEVIDVYDNNDGERIKVRISPEDDRIKDDNKLPFAYPLLPKMLHVKPKQGESVLIILTEVNNGYSDRYYIGPLISQPQFMDGDKFGVDSFSTYSDSFKEPDIAPSTNADSQGALVNNNDIAIYGRTKNDIILTDNDIRIRSGSRLKDTSVKGHLVYNRTDPAYIHLKHSDNKRGEENDTYRSTATIVADKINLLSNTSKYPFKLTDKNDLISDNEMQKIIESAHALPYGDKLVEFLNVFIDAFISHTHPYPGMIPDQTMAYNAVADYPLETILSNSVRIN